MNNETVNEETKNLSIDQLMEMKLLESDTPEGKNN